MGMLIQLAIGVGLLLFAIVYHLAWKAKQRRRQPLPPDVAKWGVPVNDPDSAIGAGWFVEVDGRRVAVLSDVRCQIETPHWLSYVITPLTEDAQEKAQLLALEFWRSDKPKYRSRKFGVLSSGALVSGIPPCPETQRIIMRGPYIDLDPGPSLVERAVALFRRKHPRGSHD
jgi:hypothetical protein